MSRAAKKHTRISSGLGESSEVMLYTWRLGSWLWLRKRDALPMALASMVKGSPPRAEGTSAAKSMSKRNDIFSSS